MIPLLVKEGSGVVARSADAATHHPLPLLPLRRGAIFIAAKDLALSIFKAMRDSSSPLLLRMTVPTSFSAVWKVRRRKTKMSYYGMAKAVPKACSNYVP
jgi:hypothetical protein